MAKKMHSDQIDIDEALLRRLLRAHCPRWSELPAVEVVSDGTANAIFRLGDGMAVRMPLRPQGPEQLDKIHRWLPTFAPHLPLSIPVPLFQGAPAEGYPNPWSVCRWLDGQSVSLSGLVAPVDAARVLAGFVVALRGLDADGGPAPGAHNFQRGVPLASRDASTRRALAQCDGLFDVDAAASIWAAALGAPVWDGPPVWVHGDLMTGNLLMTEGRISGVIDWGGLGVGDPATDMLPAWNLFEGDSRAAFREAVGVDDATWARGRGLALSVGIVALPYYLETNPVAADWARRMIGAVLGDAL